MEQRVKSPSDTLSTGANEPSGTDGQNGPWPYIIKMKILLMITYTTVDII